MSDELLVPTPATEHGDLVGQLLADCPAHVVAHSARSYQFAGLVAAEDGVELDDIDHEALYLGVLLHDLGLAASSTGDDRFEVRGADRARSALRSAGLESSRAEMVWDVIAMHATSGMARSKSIETRLANRGISIDIRGPGREALPPDRVRAVLDRWPRTGFVDDMAATLIDEVRARPASTRFNWMESIAVRHVADHHPVDFLDALTASADFV